MPEALFLLSQVARPPAHASAPHPAQSPQVSREVCVLRMFGQSRLFDQGCQQIATTAIVPFNTGLWQHSSQAVSGWFGRSRQTVKSRHFVPTAW